MRKSRSKKLRWLNELAAAYQVACFADEMYVWTAYTAKLRQAAVQLARFSSGEDSVKYEKKIRIAMLELQEEVRHHST